MMSRDVTPDYADYRNGIAKRYGFRSYVDALQCALLLRAMHGGVPKRTLTKYVKSQQLGALMQYIHKLIRENHNGQL